MARTVRCKMTVEEVAQNTWGPGTLAKRFKLRAVAGGAVSPENEEFFKTTPTGELSFTTLNPNVADILALGNEYFIDITPATS